MEITRKALAANGRSRACGKCKLGVANCNSAIQEVCSKAFVEGYKKGYEQGKRDNSISRSSLIKEICKRGGIV